MNIQKPLLYVFVFSILISSASILYAYAQESHILELTPTDDAYILANLQDPEDKQELRKINSGSLDHLKVGYALNTNDVPNQNLAISLLKFDLTNLSADQIDSVTLQLYADQIQLLEPQDVGVFFL